MASVDLSPGDRVVLSQPGSDEYVDLAISLLALGLFPVPLDPHLTQREFAAILDDVDPALIIDTPERVSWLLGLIPDDAYLGLPLGRPMHVTSGTTGRPKPVDSGLLTREHAEALLAEERELWGFRASDINLVVSPIHHSAPLRFAIGTRLAGGRLVFPGPFDVTAVTAAIVSQRPTTMFVVPTHLQRLFRHWDEVGVPDLSCFRLVAHAGAPCPVEVKHRLIELFPEGSTWEFYGSTEGQFTACPSAQWLGRPGTLGRARPGRRLFTDEAGHIWCVVPEHARFSYRNAPEKTAAAWREEPDGWAFTVGDLGRVDDDGHVWLDGRREDLIISGGVNVYPLEVENIMREHPLIDDIAVFGVPDSEWGQRVCAAYVGTASVSELDAFARERLAPAKRPKEWTMMPDLPRTATGKVRRADLGT